jgi:ABC-2 type transport system ATP-binding protein
MMDKLNVALLETRDLTRTFGDFVAVDGVSITLMPGEIVAFLGPNGAGKTTTLKMITGLLQPTRGSIRVNGYDLASQPIEAKAQFGYVPDSPDLYEKLTAVEYLRFMGQLYRVPRDLVEKRIRDFLAMFGLTDSAGGRLEGFSHGMQQKVAVSGALIHEPKLLYMDEPTVGLDPKSARLLKDILYRLRDEGTSILFSTHILEIAQTLANRILIINHGRIIAQGTMEELRSGRDADESLEDIFLEVTGGADVAEVAAELRA